MKNLFEVYEDFLNNHAKNIEDSLKLIEQHEREISKLKNKIKNIKDNAKFFEIYKQIIKEKDYEFELTTQKRCNGQKISCFDYFKKSLEKELGYKLSLIKYETNKTKTEYERVHDSWESIYVTKTLVDDLLIQKGTEREFLKKCNKMSIEEYLKYKDESQNLFELFSMWEEDVEKSKITILKEPDTDTCCYGIKINKLQELEYYPSSYENPMFFKALLKTMDYENKCNEIETYLEEQRYIEVQQEKLNRQQEELKRRQENYQKQLQKQDDYCM